MTYQELIEKAKDNIGTNCKVCPICNGIACKGKIPGPGGKGTGAGFYHSYDQLRKMKLNMNTLYTKHKEIDSSIELFGRTFDYPIFAAPIGAVALHYSDKYNDLTYSQAILSGCQDAGVIGFTGDGIDDTVFSGTIEAIKQLSGLGIPTIKPWSNKEEVFKKIRMAEEANAFAIAMDVDAGGLTILAAAGKPVGPVSLETLREYVEYTKLPFIVKGVMTVAGAMMALEAGAKGIIVSNHGGRVLDETSATIDVLEPIAEAVKGKMKIFIDGAFRSGIDIIKALALGADAVLIGRPYAISVYGGDASGVSLYTKKIGQELKDAMIMIGAEDLSSITRDKVVRI
jgi:isopentenyl diphosphate isomerase/L-lactate dehydrogenase-like FMN-dependent dehydrogenase